MENENKEISGPIEETNVPITDEASQECNYIISVIIPAYNSAEFIVRTLEMIISQTIENFEIIVIDDGSEDDTFNIVNKTFSNSTRKNIYLKLLKQDHAGVSSARNLGLEKSRGEFIMFFDSDDFMEPDCLEKLLSPSNEKPYDSIICGYDIVLENGKTSSKYTDRFTYFQNGLNGTEVIGLFLTPEISLCVGNIIHRRSLLIENNIIFTPGARRGEDAEFNVKALYFSKNVGCVPESLVKYIQRKRAFCIDISQIFEINAAKVRIWDFLIANNSPKGLIELMETKTIPESYRTTLHVLRHAGVFYSDVTKTKNKEEIELLIQHNSATLKTKMMLLMYIYTPRFLFFLTRIQHKLNG